MIHRRLGKTDVLVPVIGQGTWKYGEDPGAAAEEIKALQFGIEHGLTLIDTAEGYANGGAERVVGKAIKDCREDVFLTTKVSAENCSYQGVIDACEQSLERLETTYIDLYLQHWPSKKHPLEETMRAMVYLVEKGLVKNVGVSNFTPELLGEAQRLLGDHLLSCNQVGYHLNDRSIENNVLPYCQQHDITVMAYSPFGYAPQFFGGQGFPANGTEKRQELERIGMNYGVTAYQVALNWVVRHQGIVAIPKAKNIEHIKSNLVALEIVLSAEDLAMLEVVFPKGEEGMKLLRY